MSFTRWIAATLALVCTACAPAQTEFEIDLAKKRQTIQGLGATATGTWIPGVVELYGQPSFATQIGTDLGASIIRLALPPTIQPVEDLDAATLNNAMFNFAAFSPPANFIKAVKQEHPELKVIFSVWTPPAWMKTNNSINNGGHLRADRREHFAKYCAAACLGFESTYGVPVYGMSIQNEPYFVEPYETCIYTPAEMRDTIAAVRAAFTKWNVKAKIMAPEDYAEVPRWMTYVDALGISKTDSKGVSILNIHGLPSAPAGDSAAGWADLRARLKNVSVPLWMTETSGEEATWLGEGKGGEGALFMAQKIHEALAIGECEAWVYWAIADPAPSEFALMALGAPTPKYAAAKHYFKYIRPGAQRVTVTPASTTILVSAYQHAEQKTITIVLINKTAAKSEVKLSIRGMPAGVASFEAVRSSATESTTALAAVPVAGSNVSLALPAQSVTTLFATYP